MDLHAARTTSSQKGGKCLHQCRHKKKKMQQQQVRKAIQQSWAKRTTQRRRSDEKIEQHPRKCKSRQSPFFSFLKSKRRLGTSRQAKLPIDSTRMCREIERLLRYCAALTHLDLHFLFALPNKEVVFFFFWGRVL
jgi:hypothetical protein